LVWFFFEVRVHISCSPSSDCVSVCFPVHVLSSKSLATLSSPRAAGYLFSRKQGHIFFCLAFRWRVRLMGCPYPPPNCQPTDFPNLLSSPLTPPLFFRVQRDFFSGTPSDQSWLFHPLIQSKQLFSYCAQSPRALCMPFVSAVARPLLLPMLPFPFLATHDDFSPCCCDL